MMVGSTVLLHAAYLGTTGLERREQGRGDAGTEEDRQRN
jgi:hypothetical protein